MNKIVAKKENTDLWDSIPGTLILRLLGASPNCKKKNCHLLMNLLPDAIAYIVPSKCDADKYSIILNYYHRLN